MRFNSVIFSLCQIFIASMRHVANLTHGAHVHGFHQAAAYGNQGRKERGH